MIKLINGWTKERVMEQVKKYNNNTKAIDATGSYTYQAENGNRCAVGCFIPDNHLALRDWIGATFLCEKYPGLALLMPFSPEDSLFFQAAHDNVRTGASVYASIKNFLDDKVE